MQCAWRNNRLCSGRKKRYMRFWLWPRKGNLIDQIHLDMQCEIRNLCLNSTEYKVVYVATLNIPVLYLSQLSLPRCNGQLSTSRHQAQLTYVLNISQSYRTQIILSVLMDRARQPTITLCLEFCNSSIDKFLILVLCLPEARSLIVQYMYHSLTHSLLQGSLFAQGLSDWTGLCGGHSSVKQ